uniref:Uncharacterized protein n=1 Tax=Meloidogyne enterolobii TaxID=390850 RepID=A0A6V7VGF3_MELEN|nr:unnamed protein product [Meloidogyne enterolobii]
MLQTDHYNYLHNKFDTDKEFLEKFKLINGTKAALYYLLKEGDYFKKLVIDEFKIVTENSLMDRQLLIKHYIPALFPKNIKDQLFNRIGADFIVWYRSMTSDLRNKQKWKIEDAHFSARKKFDEELSVYFNLYDAVYNDSFNEIRGRTGYYIIKSMAVVKNRMDVDMGSTVIDFDIEKLNNMESQN